jgi:hypothetical protein
VKDYTSKVLKTVAVVYMAFPLSYLAATAILFDIPAAGIGRILLSAFFYLLSGLAITTGYGLWEMRRWAWYLMLGVNILIAYENANVLHSFGESHHPVLAYIASLLILSGLMHQVSREIRVPYFFPKIRWWESNPRYKLSVPVHVVRPSVGKLGEPDPAIEGEILDLSMGGCFVKLRSELKQDEMVTLTFRVFGMTVESKGTVVWRTQSTVTHPKGIGIKFSLPTRPQKRVLRQVTGRLRKIATLYRRSRYLMSQEEFMRRLDELEKHGVKDSA